MERQREREGWKEGRSRDRERNRDGKREIERGGWRKGKPGKRESEGLRERKRGMERGGRERERKRDGKQFLAVFPHFHTVVSFLRMGTFELIVFFTFLSGNCGGIMHLMPLTLGPDLLFLAHTNGG